MKRTRRNIPFSEATDRKLIKLVDVYGTKNWNMISRNFQHQSASRCKERWFKFLSPRNEHIPWTPEEDELLFKLESKLGAKWTAISQSFVKRTPADVRIRFRKLKLREMKLMNSNSKINKEIFLLPDQVGEIEEPKQDEAQENESRYLIDKIFGPHCEEFILELSGLYSFDTSQY